MYRYDQDLIYEDRVLPSIYMFKKIDCNKSVWNQFVPFWFVES